MIDISKEVMEQMQNDIFAFLLHIFNLVPQPIRPEYQARFAIGLSLTHKDWDAFAATVRPFWFEEFQEGRHITWQQSLVFHGINKATANQASSRLSVVSGHGIGKSAIFALVTLWFLFVRLDSQVACTAPSADQMYDVLWKEIKKWIDRMPPAIAALYVWESSHIRMKEGMQTWFARAKTSSKENTEALAGIHADWVALLADEASGIEEPIFETMEGALTSGNTLVLLAGNGTRSLGYFYDTHHKDSSRWQTFAFSSMDSPRIPAKYVDDIIAKYGSDSVQYAIRVEGKFPDEGIMDDKGYVQLFNEADIHIVPFDTDWQPRSPKGALDPSGEGQDSSEWGVRDRIRAGIVASEAKSTPAGMAEKSVTVVTKYRIHPYDFVIDAFGAGHQVSQEIALMTAKEDVPWRVYPVNTGEPCPDPNDAELYMNIRAMCFYKMMLWCRSGGEFMDSPGLKDELLSIRFRRTASGRIQIMDKISMKKLGFKSPNKADTLSMTFLKKDTLEPRGVNPVIHSSQGFDPHATMD